MKNKILTRDQIINEFHSKQSIFKISQIVRNRDNSQSITAGIKDVPLSVVVDFKGESINELYDKIGKSYLGKLKTRIPTNDYDMLEKMFSEVPKPEPITKENSVGNEIFVPIIKPILKSSKQNKTIFV